MHVTGIHSFYAILLSDNRQVQGARIFAATPPDFTPRTLDGPVICVLAEIPRNCQFWRATRVIAQNNTEQGVMRG
jgi:hypothetical protein